MSFREFNQVLGIQKEESVLDKNDNQIKLYERLKGAYDNRPKKLSDFIGAMADNEKQAYKYTKEQIELDEKYVKDTRDEIEKTNSSYGQKELSGRENGFAYGEMAQSMITDLINNVWFPGFKAIMTHDFDDLKAGIDTVLKKGDTFLGLGIDFTISGQEDTIAKKLEKEWSGHVTRGKIATVKYFKDPDTGKMGSKVTPKFIIGSSKSFVEEAAAAYLAGNEKSLEGHPMRESFIRQIETQLNNALDYFEERLDAKDISPEDFKKFSFTKMQYEKVYNAVSDLKKSSLVKVDPMVYHMFSKESVAERAIKNFYNSADGNN